MIITFHGLKLDMLFDIRFISFDIVSDLQYEKNLLPYYLFLKKPIFHHLHKASNLID